MRLVLLDDGGSRWSTRGWEGEACGWRGVTRSRESARFRLYLNGELFQEWAP